MLEPKRTSILEPAAHRVPPPERAASSAPLATAAVALQRLSGAPGAVTPAQMAALQRAAGNDAVSSLLGPAAMRRVAAQGLTGSPQALPHRDRIEDAFGRYGA